MSTIYFIERTPYECIQQTRRVVNKDVDRRVEELLDKGYEILAVIQGE